MDLPAPARALAAAIREAVISPDDDLTELATMDGAPVVMGDVLRFLLEYQHPDGLDADDIRAIVTRSTGDPQTTLIVLVSAMGIHPSEQDVARPSTLDLVHHAALLIADLLGPRRLDPYLQAAFAEIARNETMEAP